MEVRVWIRILCVIFFIIEKLPHFELIDILVESRILFLEHAFYF